jgi:hypothetical protein
MISFPGIDEVVGNFTLSEQRKASFDDCRYVFVQFAVAAKALVLPAGADLAVKWMKRNSLQFAVQKRTQWQMGQNTASSFNLRAQKELD